MAGESNDKMKVDEDKQDIKNEKTVIANDKYGSVQKSKTKHAS
jgi:hypothetical protein